MHNVTDVAEESEDNDKNTLADNSIEEVKNTFRKADSFAGNYTLHTIHISLM